jgi:hypothetical protein
MDFIAEPNFTLSHIIIIHILIKIRLLINIE